MTSDEFKTKAELIQELNSLRKITGKKDYTERRQTLEEIKESENKFETLVESSNDSIFIIQKGIIQYVNPELIRISGYTINEIIGRNFMDFVAPEEQKMVSEYYEREVTRNGAPLRYESIAVLKSGDRLNVEVSVIPIQYKGEKAQSVICRDITERKLGEKQVKQLNQAIDTSGEAAIMTDREGLISYVNSAFTGIYGYTAKEVVGKVTPRILKSGVMNPEEYAQFWETLAKGEKISTEMINKTKAGRLITVHTSVNPVFDEQQNIGGFLAIQRDITKRKLAEEQNFKYQKRLAYAQSIAHVSDWEWEVSTNKVTWSDELFRIYGYEPGDFTLDFDFVKNQMHPDSLAEFMDALDKALKGEKTNEIDYKFFRKDGSIGVLYATGDIIRDEKGNPLKMVGIVQDITQRKQAELELQEATQMKEMLLDIITHDIKNPAGNISNAVEILLDEQFDHEMVEIIKGSSDKLLQVMEDATILAQVATGEKIEMKETNLSEVIQSVAKEYSDQLHRSEMTIELDLPSKILVEANPIIANVFSNYISNAIKYATEGKKIIIDTEESDGSLMINVKDFGTTIAEEHRENIFERTYQIDGKKKGRGLGLSIVKKIAEAHQAEVGVKPNTPKGNIFYLKIPCN
ncbi:MAG: PAS domain S-box protein [Candidatus Marinimicrobia bacterium]|nr:PAS domain S-box protein [Candidatus Neomarinimicrobiota bacterium]